MPKFTSFTFTPGGTLVYRNSGQIAPEKYYVKGNTVYSSETGRKVGNAKKFDNLTSAEKQKVLSAEKSRTARYRRRYQPWDKGKPKKSQPKKPSKKAQQRRIRDPDVPVSEEYLQEYINLIKFYAVYVHSADPKANLLTCTMEEADKLHHLAYDVYEA
ncbi:MAG: hypothetical protein IIZ24_02230, partial [Candidatus Methanomethylophilus sp.]|nr:hypothetical protein [Methanomethylophilus sp.]